MKAAQKALALTILFLMVTLCSPQTKQLDGATYIESTLVSKIEKEGGKASELWRRPWRFVVLFNSVQAANKSGYTNAALSSVRVFLTRRSKDGQPHRVAFYPYQLDLYTKPGQAVEEVSLNIDTVNAIEQVFPRIPFSTLSDGVTPFPKRGGHNNLLARQQLGEIIGKSTEPTLVIQLTDIEVSEEPGSDRDLTTRDEDRRQRGLEKTGLVAYSSTVGSLETNSPRQRLYVLLYGPQELKVASKGGFPSWLILVVLAILILAAAVFVASRAGLTLPSFSGETAPKWSVTLPGASSVTLEKGVPRLVVGPNAPQVSTEGSIVLRGEDIPDAILFEIQWSPKGVQFKDHIWSIHTASSGSNVTLDSDTKVECRDKTSDKTRYIEVRISRLAD